MKMAANEAVYHILIKFYGGQYSLGGKQAFCAIKHRTETLSCQNIFSWLLVRIEL